jgi:hypothetical protein
MKTTLLQHAKWQTTPLEGLSPYAWRSIAQALIIDLIELQEGNEVQIQKAVAKMMHELDTWKQIRPVIERLLAAATAMQIDQPPTTRAISDELMNAKIHARAFLGLVDSILGDAVNHVFSDPQDEEHAGVDECRQCGEPFDHHQAVPCTCGHLTERHSRGLSARFEGYACQDCSCDKFSRGI